MRPVFVVRPEAEVDIDEAFAWYERRSAGLGGRFLDAVEATIRFVQDAPQWFPAQLREPDLTIRRALVDGFPYGVFFIWNTDADATSVIACIHARRDPRRWIQRA